MLDSCSSRMCSDTFVHARLLRADTGTLLLAGGGAARVHLHSRDDPSACLHL